MGGGRGTCGDGPLTPVSPPAAATPQVRPIPGLQAPQPNARQSSRATEQTSRQSADSWFWTHPVQAPGPRDIGTAPSPQSGWLGLGESCLHIQEHLEQGGWLGHKPRGP